jgi:hypothetical protein
VADYPWGTHDLTRTTYTYAGLEVSAEAYDEIAGKLKAAGYGHAFMPDGAIDMHGIGLMKPLPPAARPEDEVHAILPDGYAQRGLPQVTVIPNPLGEDASSERQATVERVERLAEGIDTGGGIDRETQPLWKGPR